MSQLTATAPCWCADARVVRTEPEMIVEASPYCCEVQRYLLTSSKGMWLSVLQLCRLWDTLAPLSAASSCNGAELLAELQARTKLGFYVVYAQMMQEERPLELLSA
jgi:hypothetical protein